VILLGASSLECSCCQKADEKTGSRPLGRRASIVRLNKRIWLTFDTATGELHFQARLKEKNMLSSCSSGGFASSIGQGPDPMMDLAVVIDLKLEDGQHPVQFGQHSNGICDSEGTSVGARMVCPVDVSADADSAPDSRVIVYWP
jgi:hypothetical protein